MVVIKRDGRAVRFDKSKIVDAIVKAFYEIDGEVTHYAMSKAIDIAKYIEELDAASITVEEIQDIVENKLMSSNRKDVAKAYILYREARSKARERKSEINRQIAESIQAANVSNQNANVDERSFGGRIGSASSAVLKKYALDHCMSDMARNNHLNNEVYIHDLDYYAVGAHNCLSVPFDKLLANGFNTRQTDVRPAQSVSTAFQLVAVIFQLQSLQQFGGVSATHLDWTMVPYVRKSFYKHYKDGVKYLEHRELDYSFHNELSIDEEDYKAYSPTAYEYALDMTKKEIYQAVEAMYHNLKVFGRPVSNVRNIPI